MSSVEPATNAAADEQAEVGWRFLARRSYGEAAAAFRLALRLQPDHRQALSGLAFTSLGWEDTPRLLETMPLILRAIEVNTANWSLWRPGLYFVLTNIEHQRARDRDSGVRFARHPNQSLLDLQARAERILRTSLAQLSASADRLRPDSSYDEMTDALRAVAQLADQLDGFTVERRARKRTGHTITEYPLRATAIGIYQAIGEGDLERRLLANVPEWDGITRDALARDVFGRAHRMLLVRAADRGAAGQQERARRRRSRRLMTVGAAGVVAVCLTRHAKLTCRAIIVATAAIGWVVFRGGAA